MQFWCGCLLELAAMADSTDNAPSSSGVTYRVYKVGRRALLKPSQFSRALDE